MRLVLALLASALASPAVAQTPPPRSAPEAAPQSPKPPGVRAPREAPSLDELFKRLRSAKDAGAALPISREIESRWLTSGSDTIDLLMGRAATAIRDKNGPLALDLLDAIVALKHDHAEAWHKRATVLFVTKDFGRSLAALERTLQLEPRHYGALAGLGTVLAELGDKKRALAAYRRALALHPHLDGIAKRMTDLAREIEGSDI